MKRGYLEYLQDMIDHLARARSLVEGMGLEAFRADVRTQLAVVHLLEIVGEAARHIPAAVRNRHAGVPWKQATGMRDRLVHGYFEVNLGVVWETVQNDAPPMLEALVSVVQRERERASRRQE